MHATPEPPLSATPPTVLGSLERLASALGGLEWVQGAGGNASVKHDGTLWVKASGKLFRDTHREGGHVGVPVALVARALDDDSLEPEVFDRQPRPSMETWFHALPFEVVSHVHSLDAAVVACTGLPAPTVGEVPVVDLPYVRPGQGLALAMRDRLPSGADEVIFLLRNHGLVVGAPTVERTIDLTRRFAAKCRESVRVESEPDVLIRAWLASPRHVVEGRHVRLLPLREAAVGRRRRDLFPDAIVYGAAWPVETATLEALPTQLGLHPSNLSAPRILEDDHGRRILVTRDGVELARATEIAAAHAWLEGVLAPTGLARYLDPSEPAALLALPSERFRQALGANGSP